MKFLVLIPFKENMTQSIHFYLLPKILSQVFGKLSLHWQNFVVISTPNQDRLCFNSRQINFFANFPHFGNVYSLRLSNVTTFHFYCSVVQIYTYFIKLNCFVSLIFLWKKKVVPSNNYYCCLQKFLFLKKNYFYTEVILRTTE